MAIDAYIKICGLTRVEDAEAAVEAGADMLGMVFHPGSKRCCRIEVAEAVKKKFAGKPKVLVFAYDEFDYICDLYHRLHNLMTFIQLPADHSDFGRLEKITGANRLLPSVRVDKTLSDEALARYSDSPLLILDAPGGIDASGNPVAGGTGQTFDWQLARDINRPFLLAGGINSANVCEAMRVVDPFGIDVASGTESSAGIKDHALMKDIINKVHNSESECR